MGRDSLSLVAPLPTAPGSTSTAAASSSTALAPGFRFHPTDEELVSYYLKRKVLSKPVRFDAIGEVDIYKHEPWDLAVYSRFKTRDQEWYFFSALDKKYGNGARMNRATNKGYWKATGKDREIRRESQLIAMKKTLVFHSGRAPDGLRTNWVMHEYRLADNEPDKSGGIQDAYVLCRVFHKNNIGPPSGNRYAPFVEEEWEDCEMALIPGEAVIKETVVGADDAKGSNDIGQEIQSINKGLININELPRDSHSDYEHANHHVKCSQDCFSLCILDKEAPLPILRYKRRRQNDSGTSNNSSKTTQEHCSSSTTTTADTMLTSSAATTTAISALLEFSHLKPPVVSEASPPPLPAPAAPPVDINNNIAKVPLPVGCGKIISELEMEIRKMSVERETLKLEMMSAEAMISILQSRIDALRQENEELRMGNKAA